MLQIYRTFLRVSSGTALALGAVLLSGFSSAAAVQTMQLSPASPKQGETLVVKVDLPADATPPVVTFNKKTYQLYLLKQEGNQAHYRSLIGVPADIAVGSHPLTAGDQEEEVTVCSGTFGTQRIRLSKEKDNFIPSPGEEAAVQSARETASARQLWSGLFLPPSRARISTRFGLRRMVNGRLLPDYFHSGLDFAGASGSPVGATQAGKVILAHTGWRLHGNVVALDHGQGVISFYLHLSKLLVKAGDVVKAGQEIGKVGGTGRATGPHLHFSLYVNGDATNPLPWFSRRI